ncbi:MAG: ATP-binding protein [Aquificaceae bacterium]
MHSVGVVLGTKPSNPLEFWIGIESDDILELDQIVFVVSKAKDKEYFFYAVVAEVSKYFEGVELVLDAQLATNGVIPVNIAHIAKANVIRVEPEAFFAPSPGDKVYIATDDHLKKAIYVDQMRAKFPAGVDRFGNVIYANLNFVNGKEGAHISISGMSGVATKTSYALFLLYSILSTVEDRSGVGTLIFNVKGKDLLWLDKKNKNIREEDRKLYRLMGLEPKPFKDVEFYCPPHPSSRGLPDSNRFDKNVKTFCWSMQDFAREGLIRFMFTEGLEGSSNLHYVIDRVANRLYELAESSSKDDLGNRLIGKDGRDIETLEDLLQRLKNAISEKEEAKSRETTDDYRYWFGDASLQTVYAFMRRFTRACHYISHFVGVNETQSPEVSGGRIEVVDISSLHSLAKMFVVGAILRRLFREKELRTSPEPRIFVVLDELNKYAPKEGWSPLKDILLDIAERGRSLGIILIGAQQTASEVEKRIVANCAIKVVGRMDPSELASKEYDFLTGGFRRRALLLKKGSMVLYQPDVPSPLLVRFPMPAWATRQEEVEDEITVPDSFNYFGS